VSFPTANPAGFSHLFPCLEAPALGLLETSSGGSGLRRFCSGSAGSTRTATAANSCSLHADENLALERVCRCGSRLLLGPSFGAFPAPCGTRPFASNFAPLRGLGSSQNKFESPGKARRANFFRAPPRKQTFGTWEPGPLAQLRPG
jgi:hypothetical protein